ncbi:MAG: hypothetical protein ACFWT7_00290 [Succiniclasticum sp.]
MNLTLGKILDYGLSLPKTLYFCFRMLPFEQAIRIPIIVSRHTLLADLSGKVVLDKSAKFGDVRIGFRRVGIFDYYKSRTILQISGTLRLNGKVELGQGTRLSVNRGGTLTFRENVTFVGESAVVCSKDIEFKEGTLVSWQCQFMDTDMHSILKNGQLINKSQSIVIGKHCWICSRCLILKGSFLHDNCVLGGGSMLLPVKHEPFSVLVGNPAKQIRENVEWSRVSPEECKCSQLRTGLI